jgi:hypothetical protein
MPRWRKPTENALDSGRAFASFSAVENAEPPPPFLGTTFSTHRISPLHIGRTGLTPARLQILSQRLRDTLVGDVVRGVQVGLEGDDNALGRAGVLELVAIRWIGVATLLGGAVESVPRPPSRDLSSDAPMGMDIDGNTSAKNALWIEIRYENALCTAILIPRLSEPKAAEDQDLLPAWLRGITVPGLDTLGTNADPKHFVSLPLLLLRMPAPLKMFIIDFLSGTFDCRVSPLRLGTKTLVTAWEQWIEDAGLPSRGALAKDMVLTLSFYVPPDSPAIGEDVDELAIENPSSGEAKDLGIKSIDVIIPAEDLRKFVRAGQAIEDQSGGRAQENTRRKGPLNGIGDMASKRRDLAGGNVDEGWGWRTKVDSDGKPPPQPFIEALALYIDQHMALNIFHPGVRVSRIACGGFALSEGRAKIFAPLSEDAGVSQPVWRLLAQLTERASC